MTKRESQHDALPRESPFHPVPHERVILNTDAAVAFYDAFPLAEGHALVVPRLAVVSLSELDSCMQAAVWDTVRLTREILAEKYHPAGFNIGINDGQAAG